SKRAVAACGLASTAKPHAAKQGHLEAELRRGAAWRGETAEVSREPGGRSRCQTVETACDAANLFWSVVCGPWSAVRGRRMRIADGQRAEASAFAAPRHCPQTIRRTGTGVDR